jgi:hypothetical protein
MMQISLPIGSSYGRNRSTYLANRNWPGRTCWLSAKSRSLTAFHNLLRMVEYFAPKLNSKTSLVEAGESVQAAELLGINYLLMPEKDSIGC